MKRLKSWLRCNLIFLLRTINASIFISVFVSITIMTVILKVMNTSLPLNVDLMGLTICIDVLCISVGFGIDIVLYLINRKGCEVEDV